MIKKVIYVNRKFASKYVPKKAAAMEMITEELTKMFNKEICDYKPLTRLN